VEMKRVPRCRVLHADQHLIFARRPAQTSADYPSATHKPLNINHNNTKSSAPSYPR